MSAYRKGNIALANAVGNGVADDKAVYAYVPDMIKYYLNEEQILPNVPTYQMVDGEARNYVFDNIENMVIKRTNQSGGYGMVMGNKISEEEWLNAKKAIEEGGVQRMNDAFNAWQSVSHKMAEALYQQSSTPGGQASEEQSSAAGAASSGQSSGGGDDNVIDAEYVDVDEDKK